MTYKENSDKQLKLWLKGESWHNTDQDECCPDFSCCRPELLASEDERRQFCEAIKQENKDIKMGMLMIFLSKSMNTPEIKKKVHIAGFSHE